MKMLVTCLRLICYLWACIPTEGFTSFILLRNEALFTSHNLLLIILCCMLAMPVAIQM